MKLHLIFLFVTASSLFAQTVTNDKNRQTFSTVICEYNLPLNLNGLSVTAFNVMPRVRLDRFETASWIILDIEAVQGTADNPSPSFKYSYNYLGKQYGNQDVGYEPFKTIRTENITYEVLVTYGSQSWGWMKSDGMYNRIGPIEKDANAAGISVRVRIVNVWFKGTKMIENIIGAKLQDETNKKSLLAQQQAKNEKELKDKENARLLKISEEKKEIERAAKIAADKKTFEENKKPVETKNNNKTNKNANSGTAASAATLEDEDSKKKSKSSSDAEETQKARYQQQAEEAQRLKEEKETAAQAKRDEEERAAQARQQEYDKWKDTAQKENDQQDVINAAATLSVFTLLGGFIYDGMSNVNPDYVYRAPAKSFTPKLFVKNDIGYSFSSDPLLFQSSLSTMKNGQSTTTNTIKADDGYYLNINLESNIGAGNNYYSFYGLLAAKYGIVPTLDGSRFAMEYGGGFDIGFKNVKLFGQYRFNLIDDKSTTSSDVEQNGSGETTALSTETIYGLKFTFGGNSSDKYRRGNINIGMIKKQYTIDSDQMYYDEDSNSLKTGDINPIEGYIFEWRQDHTFRLFIKYYESHNFIGTVNKMQPIGSGLNANGSLFEIGFVRALDFF